MERLRARGDAWVVLTVSALIVLGVLVLLHRRRRMEELAQRLFVEHVRH